MKQPNGFQQKKIERLRAEGKTDELTAYTAEHGFAVPPLPVPTPASPALVADPHPPAVEPVKFPGVTATTNNGTTTVTRNDELAALGAPLAPSAAWEGADDSTEGMARNAKIRRSAATFKRLYDRLEANAAHSVLNWEETNDLVMLLTPHYPTPEELAVELPKPPVPEKLPDGQRWATIVGEPMNRLQKFIKFPEDEATAPVKILFIKADYGFMHPNRMIGRKIRCKKNPNEQAGGFVLA